MEILRDKDCKLFKGAPFWRCFSFTHFLEARMKLPCNLEIWGVRNKSKDSYGGVFRCAGPGGDSGIPSCPCVPFYGYGKKVIVWLSAILIAP